MYCHCYWYASVWTLSSGSTNSGKKLGMSPSFAHFVPPGLTFICMPRCWDLRSPWLWIRVYRQFMDRQFLILCWIATLETPWNNCMVNFFVKSNVFIMGILLIEKTFSPNWKALRLMWTLCNLNNGYDMIQNNAFRWLMDRPSRKVPFKSCVPGHYFM